MSHRFPGPIPTAFDSVNLEWSLRIYISNKFPGDADAANPQTTLGEPLTQNDQNHCDEEP